MEHAIEYAEAIKGNKVDMCKIKKLGKHMRVNLLHELLRTKGVTLTNVGKDDQVVSSVSYLQIEFYKRSSTSEGDRVNKLSVKVWKKFMQWLRPKKVCIIRNFKVVSEWKWQHDDNEDKFYIKRDDNEYDEHVHDDSNL